MSELSEDIDNKKNNFVVCQFIHTQRKSESYKIWVIFWGDLSHPCMPSFKKNRTPFLSQSNLVPRRGKQPNLTYMLNLHPMNFKSIDFWLRCYSSKFLKLFFCLSEWIDCVLNLILWTALFPSSWEVSPRIRTVGTLIYLCQ